MAEMPAHALRDKLLMHLHNFAGDSTGQSFDLDEIAGQLSLSPQELIDLVRQLADLGLVRLLDHWDGSLRGDGGTSTAISLTTAGIDHARQLARPAWKRLLTDRAFLTALLALALSKLVDLFLKLF